MFKKYTRADIANRLASVGYYNKFRVRTIEVMGKDYQDIKVLDWGVMNQSQEKLEEVFKKEKHLGYSVMFNYVAPKDANYTIIG